MACKGGSFVANGKASVYRNAGYTRYGVARYQKKGTFPVNILKFSQVDAEVSIRTDRSGTGATANQEYAQVQLLIGGNSKVMLGDVVLIKKRRLRIVALDEVYDLFGDLDHFNIGLMPDTSDGDNVYGD
ncbi:hypothetical protein ABXV18_24960 [Vibrio owensii]|uniref:hypothetical protein n=1 Tax=Vibrio owensii TaxID=696485 RepID=UPI003396FE69